MKIILLLMAGVFVTFCMNSANLKALDNIRQKAVKTGKLCISVVYDNYEFKEGLESRWGFGCVIRGLDKAILFDTGGDGDVLLGNMEKMGIDPDEIQIVVISHAHWDHRGG